jgi:hypothetical protein
VNTAIRPDVLDRVYAAARELRATQAQSVAFVDDFFVTEEWSEIVQVRVVRGSHDGIVEIEMRVPE